MKSIIMVLLGLVVMATSSCGLVCQCEPISNEIVECRLVNAQGQNLVFGTNATYRIDSLRLISQPTAFFSTIGLVSRSQRDSTDLKIDFPVLPAETFLYYNSQTTPDRFEVTWGEKREKCCGESFTYSFVQNLKFNGIAIQPTNGVYIIVK